MKKVIPYLLLLAVLLGPLWLGLPITRAAGATVVFGPSNLSMTPGGQTSMTIMISSDVPVSSLDITVAFPASLVSVVKADTSGSDYPVVLFQPKVDNGAGTVHFVQTALSGVPNGKVGTITFQAKGTGDGSLVVKSAKVVSADGKGTNVYSGASGGSIHVQNAPQSTPQSTPPPSQTFRPVATTAPTISSSTHPDQDTWYASRDVDVSWSGGADGYNVVFDQSSATQLTEKVTQTSTKAHTTLADNGVWFVHVRAKGSSGWSATSHFRLQVDTMVPVEFTPLVSPEGKVDVLPQISFKTTDATSGIDRYEIKVGDADWVSATSPYQVPKINAGSYAVKVKAYDKAGNTTIGETQFTLVGPDAPVITKPSNKSLFMLGETVQVEGKAQPKVSVDLFLNGKKLETVLADENGFFKAKSSLMLFAGAYKLMAQAISPSGLSSQPSAAITLTIDAKAVKIFGAVWPGWLIYTLAIIVVGVSVLLAGLGIYRVWRLGKSWVRRVGWMKQSLREDLAELSEAVDEAVDSAMADDPTKAQELKEELNKAVDEVEAGLDEVEATMLEPEPWVPALPILHGRERFGAGLPQKVEPSNGEETDVKAASSQLNSQPVDASTSSDHGSRPNPPIPSDARVVFGAAEEAGSKGSRSQEAKDAEQAEVSKEQVVATPAKPESMPPASTTMNVSDTSNSPDAQDTPNVPPTDTAVADPQPEPQVAPSAPAAKATDDEPEITVDLFAPKIEEHK